jgi:hypothetical protein
MAHFQTIFIPLLTNNMTAAHMEQEALIFCCVCWSIRLPTLSLEVKVACWWEGLHQVVWATVLQAVEEPLQCLAVWALEAGSPLPHHQVAAGLTSPATSFPQALTWIVMLPPTQPNLYNSLYLNFLPPNLLISPHQSPSLRSTLHLHSFYISG